MRETWEDLDRIQYIEYEAETVFDYNNLDSDLYIQEYMNRFSAQIFEAKKYSDDTWNNLDVLWTTYSPSWEHTCWPATRTPSASSCGASLRKRS